MLHDETNSAHSVGAGDKVPKTSACIDITDASKEYTFLQMRQYLRVEALKTCGTF